RRVQQRCNSPWPDPERRKVVDERALGCALIAELENQDPDQLIHGSGRDLWFVPLCTHDRPFERLRVFATASYRLPVRRAISAIVNPASVRMSSVLWGSRPEPSRSSRSATSRAR